MIRKIRCNLCTLLLGSSIGTSALFLRFDLITVGLDFSLRLEYEEYSI